MLVRAARREIARRGPHQQITGPELEDLAYQAAGDALLAITQKIGQFRGESRFTTWAYKFVVFEVSAKIGRHFWRNPARSPDAEDWDRLPDRFGFDPARESEWRDLLGAVRRAVETELTPRQREVFVAIVLNDVPLDALVVKLGSNRNAIYKTMFDARRELRAKTASCLRSACVRKIPAGADANRGGRKSGAGRWPSARLRPAGGKDSR